MSHPSHALADVAAGPATAKRFRQPPETSTAVDIRSKEKPVKVRQLLPPSYRAMILALSLLTTRLRLGENAGKLG
jgi:hypothetical protein